MRRLYFKRVRPFVTDDGYRVRGALLVTADSPGGFRLWSNAADTRRTFKRVLSQLVRGAS